MLQSHLHPVDLTFPHLPAGLAGVRMAHVTDLHVRRPLGMRLAQRIGGHIGGRIGRHQPRGPGRQDALRERHRRLVSQLSGLKLDLLLLTGDLMDEPGDEEAALAVMRALCQHVRPRRGIFGVFGNHDRASFVAACQKLPVRWLRDDWVKVDGLDMVIGGLHMTRDVGPDAGALALARASMRIGRAGAKHPDERATKPTPGPVSQSGGTRPPATSRAAGATSSVSKERPLQLVLSHVPMLLPVVGDLGVDVMFCGHTHGGQFRPLPGHAVYNSTDWPLRLTSGLLRHQHTLCATARGLGEAGLPLRLFCPPQLPIYTLRQGPMPGRWTTGVDNLQPW